MNLVFSYSQSEDYAYRDLGYEFLGAASDPNGNEVHVFRIFLLGA